MKFDSLHDLFIEELKDLYDAEKQMVRALPRMADAALSSDLKQAFQKHLEQTQDHIERLEKIASQLNTDLSGKRCVAMAGIIQEGEEMMRSDGRSAVTDAALIAAAQRMEHYEMAVYGTVRTYARELDYGDVDSLLQKTLDEEGDTDEKLIKLATGGLLSEGINEKAQP
jgi:ferritin-like metal-binding protein YciE